MVVTDEDGLVRAIASDPGDDTALLVYADWLEEQGADEHAELIRETVRPANPRKTARRRKLDMRLRERLVADLPCSPSSMHTRRGLLDVTFLLRDVLTKAFSRDVPAALRRHHVHEVRIVGRVRDWSRLANVPAMAHVRSLCLLGCRIRDMGAAALGRSPHLSGLCSLNVDQNEIGPEGTVNLFRGGLAGLCAAGLAWNHPGVEGLRALADRPGAENLRWLNLSCAKVGPDGAEVLAASPGLRNLMTLYLHWCDLGDRGLEALAGSPHLAGLANLTLSLNGITEAGVRAVTRSSMLARLRWLDLSYNAIGPDAAEALRPHERARLMLSPSAHVSAGVRRAINQLLPGRIIWR